MRRVQRHRSIPATFTNNELSTDHVYTGCKQAKIYLIPATQRVEHPLHFAESEANQLCILGVHLKNYSLSGIALCLLV